MQILPSLIYCGWHLNNTCVSNHNSLGLASYHLFFYEIATYFTIENDEERCQNATWFIIVDVRVNVVYWKSDGKEEMKVWLGSDRWYSVTCRASPVVPVLCQQPQLYLKTSGCLWSQRMRSSPNETRARKSSIRTSFRSVCSIEAWSRKASVDSYLVSSTVCSFLSEVGTSGKEWGQNMVSWRRRMARRSQMSFDGAI